ncbi:monosaccharide ABC transporter ATP-binding protein, CUT2 family [Agrococcus baldri]|uniref:Monosaccharide ABC transporter ATP-binding protein, CUT2 family n=1 Tax=Agrococcus baldri TaxID=153730 RepID=A0AA94HPJ1_9MICO|nr:sugar ABC transporter ATP-binding protein [Agrococcus baldri]SFS18739.1 monosaccharide ABC transporter ATP-binding protein, CUT2 family [Agrococcus baldri]
MNPPADSGAVVLRATGIVQSFLGTAVLHGVDLELRKGEVHGLVGENGAGKSTLMKVLAGVHQPDHGSLELDGEPIAFTSPLQAQRAGIATVYQEFTLLVDRTIAENIWLGREPRRGPLVDRARMLRDTRELLETIGVPDLDPSLPVRQLSVAEQQVVEIAKAVSLDATVISMDEPTAALADHEVALLARIIAGLTDRGIAILYVSHRLREVFDLCTTITVLKDGALVGTWPAEELDERTLVRQMVGRELSAFFPDATPGTEPGEPMLELEGAGNDFVDDVSLTVRAGEIVGIAGLQGAGRTELLHGIFGADPFSRGTMRVAGRRFRPRSPRHAVRAGLALITEDRKTQGLSLNLTVLQNALGVVRAVFPSRTRAARDAMPSALAELELVARGLDQEVQFLSGGNQQKVVLARWLAVAPGVVLLDEPTRGIDVGAKFGVYEVMRRLAASGVAILMVSSELPEVLGMSDRILVMRDGRLAGELPSTSSEEDVLALATGADEEAAA